MSRAFDSLPGAVGSPPQHYGNPFGEQRALAEGEAIVDLSDRAVLTITGEDRLSWLDSLTSQSIAKLQPGESAETLLLDPTGRLEHDIRLIDDGVSTWLLVDASEAESLQAWLSRMVFMLRVEVADVTADYATIGTLGEPSFTAASPNGVPLIWNDPWREVQRGGHQYSTEAQHPAANWTYAEHLVDRAMVDGESPVPQLVAAVPAANDGPAPIKVAGTDALEALRIAAWRPRLAAEADERTIPHELDWLRSAVHLSKGCYRGQETIAKVHNLGHPPRRLVMLHLDGSDGIVAAHGDAVLSGDTEVGQVTSAARHYELGPIALAVVKRTTDPEAPLTVHTADGDIAAAQQVIVPPSAGAEADVPRLPRLRASAPQASN